MSRARWLALGSALALAGCGGIKDPGRTADPSSGAHGGSSGSAQGDAETNGGDDSGGGSEGSAAIDDASTVDAVVEDVAAADAGAADALIAEAGGGCAVRGSFDCAGQSCNAATQFCQMSYGGTEISCNDDDGGGFFPSECTACPTCACVTQYLGGSCQCVELDAGGIGLQCGTCYGAPPTRLELLAAA